MISRNVMHTEHSKQVNSFGFHYYSSFLTFSVFLSYFSFFYFQSFFEFLSVILSVFTFNSISILSTQWLCPQIFSGVYFIV